MLDSGDIYFSVLHKKAVLFSLGSLCFGMKIAAWGGVEWGGAVLDCERGGDPQAARQASDHWVSQTQNVYTVE